MEIVRDGEATIESIKKVTVEEGAQLPAKVTAVMSDKKEVEKDATWLDKVKTDTVETKTVRVTVDGKEYDVELEVTKKGVEEPSELADPAAGAKKEAEKITNKLTFEVADIDKASTRKVVEAAITEAQKLVAEGYKVTTTGKGIIEEDKLTVTFIVTGNKETNKAQTSELTLTFTVAKTPVDSIS